MSAYRCLSSFCPRQQIASLVAAAKPGNPESLAGLAFALADGYLCVRCGASIRLPTGLSHVTIPDAPGRG